jgi:hypothetical protein
MDTRSMVRNLNSELSNDRELIEELIDRTKEIDPIYLSRQFYVKEYVIIVGLLIAIIITFLKKYIL